MSKKLKLSYQTVDGDKTKKKSKTYANIRMASTDVQLKEVGDALLGLIDGQEPNVTKIEETILG